MTDMGQSYAQANSARDQANTARGNANDAYSQANTAYSQANSARGQANTAYGQANSARSDANTTFATINTTFGTVNTNYQAAYAQANNARDQANTARTQANTGYDQANTARTQANTAYGQANSAYGQANAAYGAANTKLASAGGTVSGDLIITGNLTVSGNQTILNTEVLTTEDAEIILLSNTAGTPALNAGLIVNRGTSTNTFLRWNEAVDEWGWSDSGTTTYYFEDLRSGLVTTNTTFGTVNTTFGTTNTTFGTVNTTFATLNTSAGTQNTAITNAHDQANSARGQANTAYGQANLAYAQANSARDQANTAYGQANSAYGAANNRVLKAGDTMTGNLTISGATLNTATANISTIITGNALTISTGTASNGNIIFSSNGTEDMRITAPGNVGIGTNSPLNPLHVAGGYNQYGQLYIQNTIGAASNANVVASVNTTGDLLTLTAATGWANGQALIIKSTVSVPGGLNSTFMYYGCMRSTTTLTLHTTVANAQAGTSNVDITSAGSGTITLMPVAELATMASSISNSSYLKFYKYRHTPGADWQTAATRIQQVIDSTHQGFIEFNPPNGTYGIAFGQGSQYFMQINSSGNVGIGTTTPSNPLHVIGDTFVSANIRSTAFHAGGRNSPYTSISETSSGAMSVFAHNASGSTGSSNVIKAQNTGYHSHFIRMYYDQGIAFHTSSGTRTAGDILYDFDTPANVVSGTAERMRIDISGNVGIGTSSPNFKEEVNQGSGSAAPSLRQAPQLVLKGWGGGGTYHSGIGFSMSEHTAGYWGSGILEIDDSGSYGAALGFYTSTGAALASPTEKMRISSSGNVGIGTTSPGSKLDIGTGDIRANGGLYFLDSSTYGTYVRANNYPSKGYSAADHRFWLEMGAKGGVHVVLNTDGGADAAENDSDDFAVFQGARDSSDTLFRVKNSGKVYAKHSYYVGNTHNTAQQSEFGTSAINTVATAGTNVNTLVESYENRSGVYWLNFNGQIFRAFIKANWLQGRNWVLAAKFFDAQDMPSGSSLWTNDTFVNEGDFDIYSGKFSKYKAWRYFSFDRLAMQMANRIAPIMRFSSNQTLFGAFSGGRATNGGGVTAVETYPQIANSATYHGMTNFVGTNFSDIGGAEDILQSYGLNKWANSSTNSTSGNNEGSRSYNSGTLRGYELTLEDSHPNLTGVDSAGVAGAWIGCPMDEGGFTFGSASSSSGADSGFGFGFGCGNNARTGTSGYAEWGRGNECVNLLPGYIWLSID
jgi:hypothetical protein